MEVRVIDGIEMTIDDVVVKYTPLVHKLAQGVYSTSAHICKEDIKAEGFIGLIHAFKKFDATRGVKFMTFAYHYVRKMMLRSTTRVSPLGRIPSSITEMYGKIGSSLHAYVTLEELVEKYPEFTKEKLEDALAYYMLSHSTHALDLEVSEGYDMKSVLGYSAEIEELSDISLFVSKCTAKEKQVIALTLKGKTQREVATVFGCSQNEVSRMLKKLRLKYYEYSNGGVAV